MPLKGYDNIRLRQEFQNTLGDRDAIQQHRDRTPGKDEVAQYVLDNVIAEDRWPLNMTELAEETGYSRQHVSNVIADYFQGVDDADQSTPTTTRNSSPMSASPNQQQQSQTTNPTDTNDRQEVKTVYVQQNGQMLELEVPPDVDQASYVRGYVDGVESQ